MKSNDKKPLPSADELNARLLPGNSNAFDDVIQSRYVGIKGFSSSNIWRMCQFYETYCVNEKLATLLRELTEGGEE